MIRERDGHIWRGQLPKETVGIQLFRPLKNGTGRCYWPVAFARGVDGVETFLARQMIRSDDEGAYGQIDLLDANGDIIEEIGIPDAHQFQRLRRKLKCPVVEDPGSLVPPNSEAPDV